MAFTSTEHVLKRIESVLEFDLLGSTDAEAAVDSDANGSLSPLNSSPTIEQVERYVVDPVIFGDLYATNRGTGIGVGYSFNTQQPDDQPQGGTGSSLTHTLPIEITTVAVFDNFQSILGGKRGYQIDGIMDDIMQAFQGARRDGTNFGVETVTLRGVQKLDGSPEQPWIGRLLRIDFRRSHRALQVG